MKKLLVIVCLSFTGLIISGDKYPHLSAHLPTKAPVRLQCEENDTAEWGTEEIAAGCQNLENAFPSMIKHMDQHIPKWVQRTSSEVDLLLIKRDWIREHWLTKKNIGLIRNNVSIITGPLALSDADITEQVDLVKGYLLMAAEEGLRD